MYRIKQIAEIIEGHMVGKDIDHEVLDFLIDSRQLITATNALFFALVTDRNNGHKYIEELYDQGVRAFVVNKIHVSVVY